MAGTEGVRLSLAGAQPKLPVILNEQGYALPLVNTLSTHILKPEPEVFPGLVDNEAFCMKLALAVGLPAAEVTVIHAGRPCLLISRYDRVVKSGTMTRLHQEDFCQALGHPPERKYQEEGGPALRDLIKLLRTWSSVPVLDIKTLVDGVIFNSLVGNADAHAKNFSLLYTPKTRRLAPFYDLVCTLAWPELATAPAMKIGGCRELKNLNLGHWKKMSKECNLGWPMIKERLASMAHIVLTQLSPTASLLGSPPSEHLLAVMGIVTARSSQLLMELGEA